MQYIFLVYTMFCSIVKQAMQAVLGTN